jgi:hypothetical protein
VSGGVAAGGRQVDGGVKGQVLEGHGGGDGGKWPKMVDVRGEKLMITLYCSRSLVRP